jgi:hypothetical protein
MSALVEGAIEMAVMPERYSVASRLSVGVSQKKLLTRLDANLD